MKFLGDLFNQIKPTYDEDAVDRLNYWWTTLITIFLSLMIGSFQFGGSPITCWAPKEFTGSWTQYLVDYCFVENTYFIGWNETTIPKKISTRDDSEIQYYQWVPFILAFQAFLFYLPHVFWNIMNPQSGISVQKIVSMATDTKNIQYEKRGDNVKVISQHLEQSIDLQRDFGGKGNPFALFVRCGKQQGVYVTVCYIITKLLYCANVIGQFFMLNTFINPTYTLWGPGILGDIIQGRQWEDSSHFPRVTFCDFEVRRLGNLHRYTVQCVIWINMLNEKIYLFLWFWMMIVAILTVLDLFYWLYVSFVPGYNRSFLARFLRVKRAYNPQTDRELLKAFMRKMRPDGVFVLRLLSSNVGDLITTDIVSTLWGSFLSKCKRDRELQEKGMTLLKNPLYGHLDTLKSAETTPISPRSPTAPSVKISLMEEGEEKKPLLMEESEQGGEGGQGSPPGEGARPVPPPYNAHSQPQGGYPEE